MKKQTKTLILFASILVLLLAVWGTSSLWLPEDEEEQEEQEESVDPVYAGDLQDVEKLIISNPDDEYVLVPQPVGSDEDRQDLVWRVQGMEDYPFDSREIERLARMGEEVFTSQEYEAEASDLSQYGLDEPQATLTVVLKDGSEHVVKIGRLRPTGNFFYVMLDDTRRVCALAQSTGNRVLATRLDLLDKEKVLDLSSTDLTYFTFERARDDLRLETEVEVVGAGTGDEHLDFFVQKPILRRGSSNGLYRLVTDAMAFSVDEFIELDPDDLSQYGLSEPQYRFELTGNGETIALNIGSSAGGNLLYAQSETMPAVFTIDRNQFQSIDIRVTDMLDRFVQLHSIWEVKQIEADLFGESFTVDIQMGRGEDVASDDVEYRLDGEDAKVFNESNRSLFSRFFQRLISVMIAGLDVDAEPENTADGRMVFHLEEEEREPREEVVEFARRDDYTYYVFIDGEYTGFYIDAQDAFYATRDDYEGILVALEKMRHAMEHAQDGVFDTQEGYSLD